MQEKNKEIGTYIFLYKKFICTIIFIQSKQLLWELAHRKEPYSDYKVDDENQWYFKLQDLKREGKPPGPIDNSISSPVKEILEKTLQLDRKKRPNAKELLKEFWKLEN